MRLLSIQWRLRERMALAGMFQTTDLLPPLAERGIHLSREQVFRLVTKTPQRLSMDTLAALCDILACDPSALIEITAIPAQIPKAVGHESSPGIGDLRPVRANVRRPHE